MIFTPRVEHALEVAALGHRDQNRKSLNGPPIPYIVHPVGVLLTLDRYLPEVDEPLACATLLHDVPEDVPPSIYSVDDMRRDFGKTITAIVLNVSEPKTADKPKLPWKERKDAYLYHLKSLPYSDISHKSMELAMGDKLHNLRAILRDLRTNGPRIWDSFNAGPAEEKWYYEACLDAFAEWSDGILRCDSDWLLFSDLSLVISDVFKDA